MRTLTPLHIVAHCSGEQWTKWLPLAEFKTAYPDREPNYRMRFPNEGFFETDYDLPETNRECMSYAARLLKKKDIPHELYFSGNKSFHLHVFFDIDTDKRMLLTWAAEAMNPVLAEAFDPANLSKKRLVAIPGQPHRKTGVLKTLVSSHRAGELVHYPEELLQRLEAVREKTMRVYSEPIPFTGKCLVAELSKERLFPTGNRHMILLPNVVAVLPREEWKAVAQAQGMPLSEVEGWASETRQFNCRQLQDYSENVGVWKDTCRKCPRRWISNDKWISILQ